MPSFYPPFSRPVDYFTLILITLFFLGAAVRIKTRKIAIIGTDTYMNMITRIPKEVQGVQDIEYVTNATPFGFPRISG